MSQDSSEYTRLAFPRQRGACANANRTPLTTQDRYVMRSSSASRSLRVKVGVLWVLILALLTAAPAAGQLQQYMTIDGITGDATPPGPAGSIEILSFSTSGDELFVAKDLDSVSIDLQLLVVNTESVAFVHIDVFDIGVSTTTPAYRLIFTNLVANLYNTSGGGGGPPIETVGFSFESVTFVPSPEPDPDPYVTLMEHQGGTDPLTEGWTGGGGSQVLDDLGSGLDAWVTDDNETISAIGAYLQTVDADVIAQGNSLGWRLSTRLRIVDLGDTPNGSPALLYRDGERTWQIHFGTTVGGDPRLELLTGVTPGGAITSSIPHTMSGGGSGYHLYELVFDPSTGSADLFIDGAEAVSNYVGAPFGAGFPLPESVFWGSASTTDTGQGNFNRVSFEVGVPAVPSASFWTWLLLVGSLGLTGAYGSARLRFARSGPSSHSPGRAASSPPGG